MNDTKQRSNLQLRVLTALVALPLTFAALFFLPSPLLGLVLLPLFAFGVYECARLTESSTRKVVALYAVFVGSGPLLLILHTFCTDLVGTLLPAVVFAAAMLHWLFAIFLVVRFPGSAKLFPPLRRDLTSAFGLAAAWFAFVWLKDVGGEWLIVWLLAVVWVADSGAYFGGRRWGRRKLASLVSPGKTIEGAACGVVAALVTGVLVGTAVPEMFNLRFSTLMWALASLLVALLSILGDLFASLLKRLAGAKDSGGLFPGHGGVMDRLDSLLSTAPLVALAVYCATT